MCMHPRRTIVRADKCLLFEPNSPCSRKFLDIVCQRLQDHEAARKVRGQAGRYSGALDAMFPPEEDNPPPFELEILEAALMVATGAAQTSGCFAQYLRGADALLPHGSTC